MAEWHEQIENEELRTQPSVAKYESLEDALNGLVKANAALATSIRVPGPDATDEDRSEFMEKLVKNTNGQLIRRPEAEDETAMAEYRATMGIPDDTSGYENPEGFKGLPDDVLAEMQKVAKSAGLTKSQYQTMVTEMATMDAQGQEAAAAAQAAESAALKAEWGLAHDERVAMTDRLLQQFTPEGVELNVGPAERRVLFNIAQSMAGQGPQAHFQPHVPTELVSPDEAKEQIAELRKRLADPGSYGGNRKDMMDRMARLTKLAYPERARA
jgi:hypothetical protein